VKLLPESYGEESLETTLGKNERFQDDVTACHIKDKKSAGTITYLRERSRRLNIKIQSPADK